MATNNEVMDAAARAFWDGRPVSREVPYAELDEYAQDIIKMEVSGVVDAVYPLIALEVVAKMRQILIRCLANGYSDPSELLIQVVSNSLALTTEQPDDGPVMDASDPR